MMIEVPAPQSAQIIDNGRFLCYPFAMIYRHVTPFPGYAAAAAARQTASLVCCVV